MESEFSPVVSVSLPDATLAKRGLRRPGSFSPAQSLHESCLLAYDIHDAQYRKKPKRDAVGRASQGIECS